MDQMAKKLQLFIVQSRDTIVQLEQYIGYTLQELMILTYLKDNSLENEMNIYAKDIQNKIGLSRSTTSVLIEGLVKKKILLRQPDERNRKNTLLVVTKKGETVFAQVNEKVVHYADRIKEFFDTEKFHKLLELTEEFSRVSDKQLGVLNDRRS